jgi:hypothetical protein
MGLREFDATTDSERLDSAGGIDEFADSPTTSTSIDLPAPHPRANAATAAELNRVYQEELAQWKALPWIKRIRTKKPEPPRGI